MSQQQPPREPDTAGQHDQEVPLPGGIANRGKVVRIGQAGYHPHLHIVL